MTWSSKNNGAESDVFRIMIVDDSAVIRGSIARALEGDPALYIASSVGNGEQAIKALEREPVDVIVLDIEMPVMDGLTALPKLKEIDPAVQVIMASTLTQRNAEISLRAMTLGATDYIAKPSTGREVMGAENFKEELIAKVKALGELARRTGVRTSPNAGGSSKSRPLFSHERTAVVARQPFERLLPRAFPSVAAGKPQVVLRKAEIAHPKIIAIGSSTGGPQALFKVVKSMGAGLPQPVVLTQHMPPSFTSILADHISHQCGVPCSEAVDGDVLEAGHYYIAPGDFHMLIEDTGREPTIRLSKGPQENFCRPAVDPMLRSLIPIYGRNILAIILTGMGQDGTRGCDGVVRAGGTVIAQDEATSVVWGMPGSVALAGLCSAILPLNDIGEYIRRVAMRMCA